MITIEGLTRRDSALSFSSLSTTILSMWMTPQQCVKAVDRVSLSCYANKCGTTSLLWDGVAAVGGVVW